MGIFRQFPYTNFHEINMDEILNIVKTMSEEWETTKAEWASYKDFIDNYFENLDVSAEVLNALRIFAEDGTLNEIMDPVIAASVTEWLDEHVTPSTPIVDNSLTIAGAAADAKTVGDFFLETLKVEDPGVIVDANDLDTGIIQIKTNDLTNWSNIPATSSGIVVVTTILGSSTAVQMAYNFANYNYPASWIRTKSSGTWGQWYANITEDFFETVLKVEDPGLIVDANDLDTGIIQIKTNDLGSWSNIPATSSGIIIITAELDSSTIFQMAYNFAYAGYPTEWIRTKSVGTWGNWYEIDNAFIIGEQITTVVDADDFTAGSIYTTTGDTVKIAHVPFTRVASIIKTYSLFNNPNRRLQTFESWGNNYYGIFAIRNNQGNGWSEWSIVRDNTPNAHNGITVIGDSLACGYISAGDGTGNCYYNLSWPAFLANKYGAKYYISGASGQTTGNWLASSSYGYNGAFQRFPLTPMYIIAMGTNDASNSVVEATFKTNYKAIISAIKARQPDAVIICLNIWRSSEPYATYNDYIDDVLAEYTAADHVYGIDITSEVNTAPISDHLYSGHYDVVGYKLIADEIEEKILAVANANPSEFRQTFADMIHVKLHDNQGYPYAY